MRYRAKGEYHQARPWINGKDSIRIEKLIGVEFDELPREAQEVMRAMFEMDKAWLPDGIGLRGWLELRVVIQYKDELDELAQWRLREGDHG
ncbi:MAG: hypothetical protein KAJ19_25265 [Gammaproteobacteria bacterium]|nr:hypothetical protein [Gammaproteobacteria bacterium]